MKTLYTQNIGFKLNNESNEKGNYTIYYSNQILRAKGNTTNNCTSTTDVKLDCLHWDKHLRCMFILMIGRMIKSSNKGEM